MSNIIAQTALLSIVHFDLHTLQLRKGSVMRRPVISIVSVGRPVRHARKQFARLRQLDPVHRATKRMNVCPTLACQSGANIPLPGCSCMSNAGVGVNIMRAVG